MKHTLLNDKYPVFSLEIEKSETRYRSLSALIDYFKEKIAENPKVQFLTVFDHFAHTGRIGGEIMPGLVGAVDIVFCFGFAIPNPLVLAVRPCNRHRRSGRTLCHQLHGSTDGAGQSGDAGLGHGFEGCLKIRQHADG